MSTMLDAALDYASRGTPVFPVNFADKHPLVEHGLKDATTDAAMIRRWWRIWPRAMIGIPTGPRSGFWILDVDVDPEKGIDGPASMARLIAQAGHGALPQTRCSITPRGGRHYWFKWNGADIRNSTGSTGGIAPGVDVRGDGGFFIAPPSVRIDGVAYRPEDPASRAVEGPTWLIELALKSGASAALTRRTTVFDPRTVGAARESASPSDSARDHAWARAALDRECANAFGNGGLNRAAFCLGQIVAGGALSENEVLDALLDAAEARGLMVDYGERSVIKTINSGLRAGMQYPRYRRA
jgi:Bifunctional DNA primase/polymerase, N-terminal